MSRRKRCTFCDERARHDVFDLPFCSWHLITAYLGIIYVRA